MRITTITVGRTYNTGNYSSQRYEASADLESDDDFLTALHELADELDDHAQHIMTAQKTRGRKADGDDLPF